MSTLIQTSHTVVGSGETVEAAIISAEQRARVFARALSKVGADASIMCVQTVVRPSGRSGIEFLHLITYVGLGIEDVRAETGYMP
jgi:hypothetical protein